MGNLGLVDYICAKLCSMSKPYVRLGEFNPKVDITKLDIPTLAK